MVADVRKIRWMNAVLAERPPVQTPPPDSVSGGTRVIRIPSWMFDELGELAIALGMRTAEVLAVVVYSYLRQPEDRA